MAPDTFGKIRDLLTVLQLRLDLHQSMCPIKGQSDEFMDEVHDIIMEMAMLVRERRLKPRE